MFSFLVAVLIVFIIVLIQLTIQELIHRFVLVGARIGVSKSDVNDSFSLDFP